MEFSGALGVGHRESDFFATVRVDIFLRHADADGIEVERLDGGSSEFFRCDGQNPGSRPRVESGLFHWQGGVDIAEQTQAARSRRVVSGAERHSRRQKNRPLGLKVVLKRLRIGMNPQSPPNRNRRAGLLGIAGPDFLGKPRDLSAEILFQRGGGFFIPEKMDREALRARFGEHDDALGIDRGQPEVANLLHGLGASAGPAEHVHALLNHPFELPRKSQKNSHKNIYNQKFLSVVETS